MSTAQLATQGILVTPAAPYQADELISMTAEISGGLFPYSSSWDFGDGSTTIEFLGLGQTHAYHYGGAYTVSVKISDATGQVVIASAQLMVTGPPPPGTVAPPLIDQGLSVSPPNATVGPGQPLSVAAHVSGGVTPYTVEWNFGDGTMASGSLTQTKSYSFPGGYIISVTVTDMAHQTLTDHVAVLIQGSVAPPPPPLVSHGLIAIPNQATVGQIVSFSDQIFGGQPPYTLQWDFGDGTQATGSLVTAFSQSHRYSSPGNYQATIKVTDSTGNSLSDHTTVNVIAFSSVGTGRQVQIETAVAIVVVLSALAASAYYLTRRGRQS